MIRGYVVHSRVPLVGRIIAWLRRNMTTHLREPYMDPMFERQVAFNRHMIQLMRLVIERMSLPASTITAPEPVPAAPAASVPIASIPVSDVATAQSKPANELADQLDRIERWLSLMTSQMDLMSSQLHRPYSGDVPPTDVEKPADVG
jgi:hypothetical protein